MNHLPGRSRSLLWATLFAMLAYSSAAPDPTELFVALVFSLLGWVLGSSRIGFRLPRWLVGIGVLILIGRSVSYAMLYGLDIHHFASMILWIMTLKFYDRKNANDDAQILSLSIFLCVASVLLSNGVAVAILSFFYLPCLAYAAMQLQLAMNHLRAQQLARKGLSKTDPPVVVQAVAGLHVARHSLWTTVGALTGGLLFAIVLFVAVPRGAGLAQIGRWGNPGVGRVVGFADHMRIGMGGVISQSNTPVMHLKLTDSQGRPVGGQGSIHYLRGAVLDAYEDGNWYPSSPPSRISTPRSLIKGEKVSFGGSGQFDSIYAHITILNIPSDTSYLFTIWRPITIKYLDPGSITRKFSDKTAVHSGPGGKFSYIVRATLHEPDLKRKFFRDPTSFDSPVVARVAASILEAHGIDPDPAKRPIAEDPRVVNLFRQYFWDHYTYKLGTPPPPEGEDPIEWFLTSAKEGHCEYYAASLAALCRSVGIPARVVTGYLAVEYNAATGHYVVRESNAHAWVEAQTEPGIWRTVDGTPPATILDLHGPKPGVMAKASRMLDALNYAWVNSIVTFDSSTRANLLSWSDPATKTIQDQLGKVAYMTRMTPAAVRVRLALRIVFSLVIAVLVGYASIALLRRRRAAKAKKPVPMLKRIEEKQVRQRIKELPIYQDMLKTLARHGMTKPGWQPPAHWAKAMGSSDDAAQSSVSQHVAQLTELFYIMRFGGQSLSASQIRHARELLGELSGLLSRSEVNKQDGRSRADGL